MSDSTPAPEPPPVNPEAEIPPVLVESPATETGLSQNICAGLAMLFSIVGGIVFLLLEKKNPYVRFYSLQAIALGAISIVINVLSTIASIILIHIPVLGAILGIFLWIALCALGLAFFVVYIVGTVKAFTGKEWEIPWVGKQVREYQKTGKFPFVG